MGSLKCGLRCTLRIRQHKLLEDLRSATIYWFRCKQALATDEKGGAFQVVVSSCTNILLNGFRLNSESTTYITSCASDCNEETDSIKRLIDDFEFLQLLCTSKSPSSEMTPFLQLPKNVKDFLQRWSVRCLITRSLSQCMQSLVTDKDLLDYYYSRDAFLRNTNYATALFICLSAIELNQCDLLSQLDIQLLQSTAKTQKAVQRRTISQPNFLVSSGELTVQQKVLTQNFVTSPPQRVVTFSSHPLFRREKSLPSIKLDRTLTITVLLRGCTTFITPNMKATSVNTSVKALHSQSNDIKFEQTNSGYSMSRSLYSTNELNILPSTSAGIKRRSRTSIVSYGTLNLFASTSSKDSNTSSQKIQVINCDNIQIWTDKILECTGPENRIEAVDLKSVATDANVKKRRLQSKSSSPINDFFANIFRSTPAYTSWSLNYFEKYSNDSVCGTDSIAALDTFLPINGKKLLKRNPQNLFQDGVSMLDYSTPTKSSSNKICYSVTTPVDIRYTSVCSTPNKNESLPKFDNQSLAAFLQMSCFSRNTDLEKENAHFRISEACISAIEHVKWAKQKQRKTERISNGRHSVINNPCIDKSTSSNSCENVLYAETDDIGRELLSAENVGLTLISKFNDKQLPKVSDLKWLVSENDTPQKMLPMPETYTETKFDDVMPSMIRGTKFWAPPRQQIIFTEHLPLNRMDLLHKQNYRCAGCGMRVSKEFVQHFRYCTYLGKYLCTGCHRNQISAIPAKILQSWDFKCYLVSVFAYRLIEQMYTYPLFFIPDLNPKLYAKLDVLATARHKRKQLQLIKDFITTCRFATREQMYFHNVPDHITSDPDMWSMADFVDVQQRSIHRSIDELILLCEDHVLNCVLCTGRGFMCEYCKDKKVIYRWQSKVQRCLNCGSCYHQKCWQSMSKTCLRCERINERQNNT